LNFADFALPIDALAVQKQAQVEEPVLALLRQLAANDDVDIELLRELLELLRRHVDVEPELVDRLGHLTRADDRRLLLERPGDHVLDTVLFVTLERDDRDARLCPRDAGNQQRHSDRDSKCSSHRERRLYTSVPPRAANTSRCHPGTRFYRS
jgi:hypothetical protein